MSSLIAIDPGKKGALVYFHHGEPCHSEVMPLAGKEIDVGSLVEFFVGVMDAFAVHPTVFMEKTQGNPKFGTRNYGFGESVGIVKGVVGGLQLPLRLVRSQDWKKVILLGTTKDKDAAISYVRQRFPDFSLLATTQSKKPHDGIADAVCIGLYGLHLERSNE